MNANAGLLRIMLVDDSANIRQVIKRYMGFANLDGIKLEFFEAGNGEEAITLLQECHLDDRPIDIICLDWNMPKMTGLEFLQNIRAVSLFEKVPKVMMLTAETYSDQINACLKYNVSKYVIKPFSQEMIEKALQDMIHNTDEGEIKYAV